MRIDFWNWSLRVRHYVGCGVFFILCALTGALTSMAVTSWQQLDRWPYTVVKREIATPKVEPGGFLTMKRLIEYHEEDCDLRYERRVQSQDPTGRRFEPEDDYSEHLRVDMGGKWQSWSVQLPENFPCGPAYLVESVSTACNEWQRRVRRLRKPDIITPFTVSCPPS